MAIFSAKARQLIDVAIDDTADPHQKDVWRSWIGTHGDVRGEGDRWQNSARSVPVEVVATALYALEEMSRRKRRLLEHPGLSEDDRADLDNDLSHIRSVERFLVLSATGQA